MCSTQRIKYVKIWMTAPWPTVDLPYFNHNSYIGIQEVKLTLNICSLVNVILYFRT